MKKKFQVFISSTYIDLIDERQSAVQAVLDAGHIPAGMELFKAGNASQLQTVYKWIEESDVYMLILGGRYGSIEPNSRKSYTQLEYEYAVSIGIPVFAILLSSKFLKLKEIQNPKEPFHESDNIDEYESFQSLVKSRIIREVEDLKDIKIAVITALAEIQNNEDLTGWVRSNNAYIQKDLQVIPPVLRHRCYKCGKEEILPSQVDFSGGDSLEYMVAINQWHKFTAKTPGYGSLLDMSYLDFELCDDCLYHMVASFKLRDEISPDTLWNYVTV